MGALPTTLSRPVLVLLDEVTNVRLRLPGLAGTGPEPSPHPLQPLLRGVDAALGKVTTTLGAAVLEEGAASRCLPEAVTRLEALSERAEDALCEEHPLAGQLALLADLARLCVT